MKKLTIGMATHDDYDGLFFSIQAIRMFHKEILDDIEFIIIDNNPNSDHGSAIRHFLNHIQEPVQYLPFTKYQSTTVKNKVFELADTPYVLCMDSHVMIDSGALRKLIDYYDAGLDDGNLLQGPLLHDDMGTVSTHFNLDVWSGYMWGVWGHDERGSDPSSEPFEIEAQGMGLFSCRKDAWLGFNKEFRGFGGEEGYIHTKFRQDFKKVMCLPFLRWNHRFGRPNKLSYPNTLEDRFRNYMIGHIELGLSVDNVVKTFRDAIPQSKFLEILESLKI